MNNLSNYFNETRFAVTVCDTDCKILFMNEKAMSVFSKSGGSDLIGKNLLDCHPEKARQKIKEMLETQTPNAYTIEKNGVKKLIYQSPWFEKGKFSGLIELSIELPEQMPHFVRK